MSLRRRAGIWCFSRWLLMPLLVVGCSSSPSAPPVDGGPSIDGGSVLDGGTAADGGPTLDGGGVLDGGTAADGGIVVDGGASDGGIPEHTILQIQNGAVDAGTCVKVDGVAMSAVFSDGDDTYQSTGRKAFYLSEKGLGTTAPRTGIEVTVNTNVADPPPIAVGEDLTVVGGFYEHFDNSTIRLRTDCGSITKNGTAAVPQPALVTLAQIGQTCPSAPCDPGASTWADGTAAEDYEGVLVRIEGGSVSATNYYGQFEVSDGTAHLLVSPHFGLSVAPNIGDPVTSITGFGHYSYGRRKIRPRSDTEVEVTSAPVDCGAGAMADHLLITEVATSPTRGEIVEIHNPTGATIDLGNYYLYNSTFPGADTDGGAIAARYYYLIGSDTEGGDDEADFSLRFPDGASIGAGAYQVVALVGTANFCATYFPGGSCTKPAYEIPAPDADGGVSDDPEVPNMRRKWDARPEIFTTYGFLTSAASGGEELVLFRWEGATTDGGVAQVQDIDYVIWGTRLGQRTDKTQVAGYLPDTAIDQQEPMAGEPGGGTTFQRICLNEGTERTSGGNGLSGHDETSENLGTTFVIRPATPGAATEGAQP